MIGYVISRIPLTRLKLFIAWVSYQIIRIFVRTNLVTVTRDSVSYQLDLSEGIDLSIYLLGSYQKHIIHNPFTRIKENAVIFDIGANMGCMSLQFAKAAVNGHVYAFEPTDFAYSKLLKNIDLNPHLKSRITPVKQFASDKTQPVPHLFAVASWKTDSLNPKGHPIHGGVAKATSMAPSITLDDFCMENGIKSVDLIKIDTEGHELSVIRGSLNMIEKHKPVIIFEVGQYLLDEMGISFMEIFDILNELGYRLFDIRKGRHVTAQNHAAIIPHRSTIDIVALP
jgi:FkbM family methyltransferase